MEILGSLPSAQRVIVMAATASRLYLFSGAASLEVQNASPGSHRMISAHFMSSRRSQRCLGVRLCCPASSLKLHPSSLALGYPLIMHCERVLCRANSCNKSFVPSALGTLLEDFFCSKLTGFSFLVCDILSPSSQLICRRLSPCSHALPLSTPPSLPMWAAPLMRFLFFICRLISYHLIFTNSPLITMLHLVTSPVYLCCLRGSHPQVHRATIPLPTLPLVRRVAG